jgi:hypothetical protein
MHTPQTHPHHRHGVTRRALLHAGLATSVTLSTWPFHTDRNFKRLFPYAPPGAPQGSVPGEARRWSIASSACCRGPRPGWGESGGEPRGSPRRAVHEGAAGAEHRRSARQRQQEAWQVPGELGPWEPQGGLGTRDGLPARKSGLWYTHWAGGMPCGDADAAQPLTPPCVMTARRWRVCRRHGGPEAAAAAERQTRSACRGEDGAYRCACCM